MSPTELETSDAWVAACGSVVVGSILVLVLLTSFAGWPWVQSFLGSAAPAWVQALGSIGAIFTGFTIVQRQHLLEIHRRHNEEKAIKISRAKTLRVIFFAAASACEDVGARVLTSKSVFWNFHAESLQEVRSRLLAFDPLQVSDPNLLLIIEKCVMHLRTAAVLVAELQTPRDKETCEAVKSVVQFAALECWLGFKEATSLELRLNDGESADTATSMFDKLNLSRKALMELREKELYRRGNGVE
jgi:hypothetical protein